MVKSPCPQVAALQNNADVPENGRGMRCLPDVAADADPASGYTIIWWAFPCHETVLQPPLTLLLATTRPFAVPASKQTTFCAFHSPYDFLYTLSI